MHPLQWFLDREGSYILRGTTEVFVTSEETAKQLFELQSGAYTFNEKVRVHRAPKEECLACQA